jgi:hypothetical protein
VLSSKGGSFRIIVDEVDEVQLDNIKKELCQRFKQEIGGTITITHVKYDSDDTVIEAGNRALRRAKLEGSAPEPVWHSPYHAICASSGEELAVAYEHPGGFPDERPRYMGQTTRKKGDENAAIQLVEKFIKRMQNPDEDEKVEKLSNPTEADTYAQFDPRQYVAYMVSDGNGMGSVFNACSPGKLPDLSSKIGEITSDALIYAVERICTETHRNGQMQFPVLPLISGGDDLFVLMPAPWAVDVAVRFCAGYQRGMSDQLRSIGLLETDENATTGAAVVICKASYPYRIAYQYAHELLGKAKDHAKKKEVNQSCLIVDFVLGSDIVTVGRHVEPHTFEDAQYFIRHRMNLKGIASRTRHQVSEALSNEEDTDQTIARIIKQVKRQYPDFEYADNLQQAYDESSTRLRELLKLWDFCYDMNKQRDEYLTEER